MQIAPASKSEFDLAADLELDSQNEGFSEQEVQQLVGPQELDRAGAKGLGDLLGSVWAPGRQAPADLKSLKSEFGYQGNPILTDLVEVARLQETKLAPMIEARTKNYNFYIMRCGAFIAPNDGETFQALKFEVLFKHDDAQTYSMLPGPQDKKLLELGGKAEIGVTGDLSFELGGELLDKAAAEAAGQAELEAKFIVSFHYELKTQLVDAYGVGNRFCRWFMHTGEKLRNDVVFYPIIMAPKSVKGFDCEFKAFFKIGHPQWKTAEFFMKPPKTVAVSV